MQVVLVAVGGCLGSVVRYLTSRVLIDVIPGFPLGTLVVNVAGCLAIGCVAAIAERNASPISADAWALVTTGFLGGFTTYSAFGLETMNLARASVPLAALNMFLQLSLGIGAVLAGRFAARLF